MKKSIKVPPHDNGVRVKSLEVSEQVKCERKLKLNQGRHYRNKF